MILGFIECFHIIEESYVPWLKGYPHPLREGFPRSATGSEWLLTSSAHTPEKKKFKKITINLNPKLQLGPPFHQSIINMSFDLMHLSRVL